MKELNPVEKDGIFELKMGTLFFAILTFVLWYRFAFLDQPSILFWLQVSLAATILGFLGLGILIRRKQKAS
jgi:hypothetical protein